MMHYLVKNWLPLAVASSILMLTVYAVVQQNYRQSANDPQIQMAEDGAAFLSSGGMPAALIGGSHVDIHSSLAPFVIVYDNTGKVIASSGYLEGGVPLLPSGVLDYTRIHVSDRITWQPASTTRVAAIVRRYQMGTTSSSVAGFIAVGRNIREVESRERQLGLIAVSAWVAIMVLTLLISAYSFVSERRQEEIRQILGDNS